MKMSGMKSLMFGAVLLAGMTIAVGCSAEAMWQPSPETKALFSQPLGDTPQIAPTSMRATPGTPIVEHGNVIQREDVGLLDGIPCAIDCQGIRLTSVKSDTPEEAGARSSVQVNPGTPEEVSHNLLAEADFDPEAVQTEPLKATEDTEVELNGQPFNLTCVNPGTPQEDCWNLIVFPATKSDSEAPGGISGNYDGLQKCYAIAVDCEAFHLTSEKSDTPEDTADRLSVQVNPGTPQEDCWNLAKLTCFDPEAVQPEFLEVTEREYMELTLVECYGHAIDCEAFHLTSEGAPSHPSVLVDSGTPEKATYELEPTFKSDFQVNPGTSEEDCWNLASKLNCFDPEAVQAQPLEVTEEVDVEMNKQPLNLTCVNPGAPQEDCWNLNSTQPTDFDPEAVQPFLGNYGIDREVLRDQIKSDTPETEANPEYLSEDVEWEPYYAPSSQANLDAPEDEAARSSTQVNPGTPQEDCWNLSKLTCFDDEFLPPEGLDR